uniref:BRISC and BRCA1-A complex member 2 n=1 Tax=Strigamia maritima TaxID=126957 RepID=T1JCT0_STRMM
MLVHLIEQLVDAYREHQIQLLNIYDRLKFEYESLLDNTIFTKDDVEVAQLRKSKVGSVNFLIRLPLDLSKIPRVYLDVGNPGEDSVVLLIVYNSKDFNKISPQIFLSPRVENAFGGSTNLRIPNYQTGSCLMDYVPIVQDLIQNKVV